MSHLRLLVPAELSAAVLALLGRYPGVAHLTQVRGASLAPAGDLIELDVVREAADELIEELQQLGLSSAGAICVSPVDLSLSAGSIRAERQAPGNSPDSVIWQQVESRTGTDSALSGTFLAFLTIAALLAGIGVVLDSPITVVGAMVVGPEFGPLAAISVGLIRRRPRLARRGFVTLAVGFPVAMLFTAGAAWVGARTGLVNAGELATNTQTEFIYKPGVLSLVVALLAGAAGMLSTTSGKSAALVGVFISVTTVPAAGYAAVATVFGEWHQVWGSALQLLINLIGIVVAGVVTLFVVRRFDVFRAARRGRRARSKLETRLP
ncbi:uncharacterized hydrophobic domain-containing protein [Nakamurella panacisegetis]|uniref:Uncharacterized hydrophobic domain-containing protein n=1 Tax=Nakamurella panacisegetis TaxID=1090615 RepID=A0A1H0QXY1_9ACTN|nr:DUF389 domain-containing protein [Nakamurella panacisegetis]SDP21739.1 uncharacterized hydrophobic domain-containing protein [Nakamurella panacisegetis]